jgi:hypothetical protein
MDKKLCLICKAETYDRAKEQAARDIFQDLDSILGGVGEWADNKEYCKLKRKWLKVHK